MNRSNPYPGELWRHWKQIDAHVELCARILGEPDTQPMYRILTTTVCDPKIWTLRGIMTLNVTPVKDTEGLRDFLLYGAVELPGIYWLRCHNTEPTDLGSSGDIVLEPHVIFRRQARRDVCLDDFNAVTWARSLSNFMAADDRSENGWKFVRCDNE